jgi:ribosome modulation factor
MLLVLGNAADYMGDTEGVKAEPDQRAMDLGHEYDPNGDGKGMEGAYQPGDDSNVVDVIAIEYQPMDVELEQAYRDGWWAATHDQPKESCPKADHRIVAQWTQGWTDFKAGADPRVDPFVRSEGSSDEASEAQAAQAAAETGDEAPFDVDADVDPDANEPEAPAAAAPKARSSASRKPAAKKPAAKKGGRK